MKGGRQISRPPGQIFSSALGELAYELVTITLKSRIFEPKKSRFLLVAGGAKFSFWLSQDTMCFSVSVSLVLGSRVAVRAEEGAEFAWKPDLRKSFCSANFELPFDEPGNSIPLIIEISKRQRSEPAIKTQTSNSMDASYGLNGNIVIGQQPFPMPGNSVHLLDPRRSSKQKLLKSSLSLLLDRQRLETKGTSKLAKETNQRSTKNLLSFKNSIISTKKDPPSQPSNPSSCQPLNPPPCPPPNPSTSHPRNFSKYSPIANRPPLPKLTGSKFRPILDRNPADHRSKSNAFDALSPMQFPSARRRSFDSSPTNKALSFPPKKLNQTLPSRLIASIQLRTFDLLLKKIENSQTRSNPKTPYKEISNFLPKKRQNRPSSTSPDHCLGSPSPFDAFQNFGAIPELKTRQVEIDFEVSEAQKILKRLQKQSEKISKGRPPLHLV